MRLYNNSNLIKGSFFISLWLLVSFASAQSSYFASSIFNNKVSFNPSQSGIEKSWRADLVFKSAIDNSQPGLSREFQLSVDGPISESAGIGLNLSKQNTGILSQTLLHFNYAYGMKIKRKLNLRMGFSAGFKSNRVNSDALLSGLIVGDPSDPALQVFNTAPPSFFSCFGLSLYSEKIEFQIAAPNLTASLQSKDLKALDYLMMRAGITYRMDLNGGHLFGPNAYVKIFGGAIQYKETGSVINAGLQFGAYDFLNFNGQYNTTGAITLGMGILIKKSMTLNFNYTVGGLYSKSIYGGSGVSEVHMNYSFNKN